MIKKNETDSPSGTQSLLRGLQLMELLSNYANGCPLARLAEETGMSKSTTHRLLQGLQSAGYVTPAPTHGSYRLTTKCVSVGQKALSSLNVLHVSARHLESLNIESGETVNLSCIEDGRAIMINKLDPVRSMIRTHAYVGQPLSLYCSAMGKLYLAHNFKGDIEDYWKAHAGEITALTRHTITEQAAMKKEIRAIEKCGYAVDREENELGICCVAAPIFDVMGRMQYAVSVSLTSVKLEQIGEKALADKVMATARRISEELGGA